MLQPAPVFRSGINLILMDVVVRDKSGAVIKDLTADDFDLLEDGVRRPILTFAFEEIKPTAAPLETASNATPSHPLTSEEVAGHRLLTLVFDTSSMPPDDVQKAVDGTMKWVDEQMTAADLVAVAAINSSLQVLTDFTSSKERMRAVLSSFAATDGTAFSAADTSTAASDEAEQTATDDATTVDQSAQELDTFNNDVRLRALKTLAPIQQKKAIIYVSSGMERSGTDNHVDRPVPPRSTSPASSATNVASRWDASATRSPCRQERQKSSPRSRFSIKPA